MTDRVAATWVVVPVFNEAPVIAQTVNELAVAFPHVVCVDDASTDGSGQLARAAGATTVTHPLNLGQGAALQTGIEYALSDPQTQFIVTFDADGQHRVADAEKMIELLGSAGPDGRPTDVVLGSRFLGTPTQMSGLKRFVLKCAVAYTNASVGIKLTDTHNGLRALTRHAAEQMSITQNSMAHATEILEQIARLHLGYLEVPVDIAYTEYSKSKGQSVLNSVNILVDLLLR